MTVVLVTGMSGTGKSSALAELARRGHQVVDTDYGDWIEGRPGSEPLWREDRIDELLRHQDGVLFVAGCVANQGKFYPRFDAVVLLSAPADVILERVATRVTNDFGVGVDGRSRGRRAAAPPRGNRRDRHARPHRRGRRRARADRPGDNSVTRPRSKAGKIRT